LYFYFINLSLRPKAEIPGYGDLWRLKAKRIVEYILSKAKNAHNG